MRTPIAEMWEWYRSQFPANTPGDQLRVTMHAFYFGAFTARLILGQKLNKEGKTELMHLDEVDEDLGAFLRDRPDQKYW